MLTQEDRNFGAVISCVLRGEDLSRVQARNAFQVILDGATSEMQQGAFLAALVAKGETPDEVAGAWEAIYELDTEKVSIDVPHPLVENSGTGMDSFKTFNVSTAASILAAAAGVPMARHGARAITSLCGTVELHPVCCRAIFESSPLPPYGHQGTPRSPRGPRSWTGRTTSPKGGP